VRGAALVLRRTRHRERNFFFFTVITELVGILGRKPGPARGAPVEFQRSPENKK
jgi:hypothetical protein